MNSMNRAVSYLALLLIVGTMGCVSTRYEANYELLQPCPPTEIPPWQRSKVYLFLMNGRDVLEHAGMVSLRDDLAVAGYPKVYYAQRQDREWYREELRRVVLNDPDARIILASYGSGAEVISGLAFEAAQLQLPVDAVVFLDPVGISGNYAEMLPFHSVVMRSHNWRRAATVEAKEHITVPGIGHLSLPRSPATSELFLRLMASSAVRVPEHSLDMLPRLPLRETPEPTPRPNPIPTPENSNFLNDRSQFPTISGGECCGAIR